MAISSRKRERRRRSVAGLVCGFCLATGFSVLPARAQHVGGLVPAQTVTQIPNGDPMSQVSNMAPSPIDAKMEQKRLRSLNAKRQQSLRADTDRLVKLAAQLNAFINSTQQGQLTTDQLSAVAEIEKLAKSIREKMSEADSGAPSVGPRPPLPIPAGPGLP
jgi:hypothetical protein